MIITRSFLLYFVTVLYSTVALFAQPFASPEERDSVKLLYYTTGPEATLAQRIHWLERLARYTLTEKDTSRYYTGLLEAEARRQNSVRGTAYAAFVRGLIALEEADYPLAHRLTAEALATAQTNGLDTIVGFAYNSLAEIAQSRGDYIAARQYYIEADRAKRTINDLKGRAITLYNQFDLALRLGYVDEAERLVDSMTVVYQLRSPNKNPEEDWIWLIVLGRLEIARGEYEAAEQHLLKVGDIGRRLGFGDRRSGGLLGRIYHLQGRYAEAQGLIEAGATTLRQVGYENELLEADILLATNELKLGRVDQADVRISSVLERANAQRDLDQAAQAYLAAADIYSAAGRDKEAVRALRRHVSLEDSVLNRDRQVALLDLEAKYENELNRGAIQRLEQTNEIQQLARQRQLTLLLGVGGVLLLTLVGTGLLWRANRTIATQSVVINDALEDKASLLSEMHHRTKNNLSIVQSLLLAQGRQLDDPVAASAIAESSDRILTIGLIHQHLYERDSGRWVQLPNYIETLCANLRKSLIYGSSIALQVQVVNRAIPAAKAAYLGLIVNELVTNSVKHAFTEDTENPAVAVRIEETELEELRLIVRDNGKGLRAGSTYRSGLLDVLLRQIKASLHTTSDDGLQLEISFSTVVASAGTADGTSDQ